MTIAGDVRQIRGRRPGGSLRIALILVAAVIAIGPAVARRLADWLWYRDVGFERVFLTMLAAQWTLGVAAGLVAFAVMYANARFALRGLPTRNLHIRDAQEWAEEGTGILGERLAAWFVLPAALFASVIAALAAAGTWRDLAQFVYRTPFGTVDPVFGRDIAFYVFTVPMIEHALTFLTAISWVVLVVFTIAVYVARGDVGVVVDRVKQGVRFFVAPRAQM